jgi:beta-barrel assembly-enhancing protease
MKPLFLALSAAIAIQVPQLANARPAPPPPPYAGAYQPQGVDEIGLWREDDESERELASSAIVIQDQKLTSYVKQVLCDAVGQDRCNSVRVYIIREPTFNASMSPNGTMRVFSGLLLRVHNEAELGWILAHEFGHFEGRHTLEHFRAHRTGTDILAWTALLTSMAPSYQNRRSYNDIRLSVYGSLYRYERDQEREADLLGIGYLNASSLRPQAAAQVWQNVIGELETSARMRGLKKPRFDAVAFTASHPPDGERAAYLSDLALPEGGSRGDGAARYREVLAAWLPAFLEDQIKLNDFGASEYIIDTLAKDGWTADLWFARAEMYRRRANQRDLVNAVDFYSRAIGSRADFADAYRGLGLSLVKTGETARGQEALRRYLALKPDASDAAMIRNLAPEEGVDN